MAPAGKRKPGGKARPFMDEDASLTLNSPLGNGVSTSSSRFTSVNWKLHNELAQIRKSRIVPYVVITVQKYLVWKVVGRLC